MTTLFLLSQPYPENLYYIDDPGKIQEKGDLTNAYFPYKKVNIINKSVLLLRKPINNLLVHLNKRRALNFDCLVRTTIFFFVWVKLWTLDFHYIYHNHMFNIINHFQYTLKIKFNLHLFAHKEHCLINKFNVRGFSENCSFKDT